MKTKISLCGLKSCCPAVEVFDDVVKIGEDGNLCVLQKDEWNLLVDLIANKKLEKI